MHDKVATFRARVRCFLADDAGPTIVEYAVALALIILSAIAVITSIGTKGAATYEILADGVLSVI